MQKINNPMDDTRKERIRGEQLRLAYRQMPPLFSGSMMGGALLTYVLWGSVNSRTLLLWITGVFITSLTMMALWRSFRQSNQRSEKSAFWRRSHFVSTLSIGCVWGLVNLLFYPYAPVNFQFVIAYLLIGASATTLAFSAFMPSFFAGFIPIMLPLAVVSLTLGGTLQTIIGVLSILFILELK